MKKRILLGLVLVVFAITAALSQNYVTQVKPAGGKLWGYINQQGEMIIPANFDVCFPFTKDGLAPVYNKPSKQYYFINVKGEKLATEISDFKLNAAPFGLDIDGFNSGMIQIKVGDQWGYMNKNGRVAVKPKYEHATVFDGGYAAVKSGSTWYVIDSNGQETKVEASPVDVKHFSENMAPFKTADKKIGFIDVHGKVAIPSQYDGVGYFANRLAWARTSDKLCGYINAKGEWVIKPQFQDVKDFDAESGLARVKKDDRWSYVTTTGESVSMNDTEYWGDFSDGLAEGKKGDLRGFFNNKGEWVIKPQFNNVRSFKNGYAAARQGDLWGMIDKKGNWVIKPTYERIMDMESVN